MNTVAIERAWRQENDRLASEKTNHLIFQIENDDLRLVIKRLYERIQLVELVLVTERKSE